ncbi:MAG: hypothetical protein ACO1SV_21640 [Fimbriimonas sp.]
METVASLLSGRTSHEATLAPGSKPIPVTYNPTAITRRFLREVKSRQAQTSEQPQDAEETVAFLIHSLLALGVEADLSGYGGKVCRTEDDYDDVPVGVLSALLSEVMGHSQPDPKDEKTTDA